jgi:hypothetical protein
MPFHDWLFLVSKKKMNVSYFKLAVCFTPASCIIIRVFAPPL